MTWMLWMAAVIAVTTAVVVVLFVGAKRCDELLDQAWRDEHDALRRLGDRQDRP